MFTRNDLIDAILRHLVAPAAVPAHSPSADSAPVAAPRPEERPRGRLFLSEHDVKKALTFGAAHLTIPRDAIISPLAQDWLALKGIRIVRS